ncbi:hypothetical protein FFF34_010975 [Inquilinus sp. KBS0705]|nr:hypothetical protein FFF34_010975 [Inquilinus sp. KBS0705]
MKKITTGLFLIGLFTCSVGIAQVKRMSKIAQLKQSPRIDSLLDDAVKIAANYDPVLILLVTSSAEYYSIRILDAPNIQSCAGFIAKDGQNAGYFEYKNRFVFVKGDLLKFHFFQKTGKSKCLTYLDPPFEKSTSKVTDIKVTPELEYYYLNGRFIARGYGDR